MLQRLLGLMAEGEPRTQGALARALGVSVPLVAQMTAQLAQQGYLIEASASACGGGCQECGLRAACGTPGGARLWVLTEKGRAHTER